MLAFANPLTYKEVLGGKNLNYFTWSQLQNSIRRQICAFFVGFDHLQSAYGQKDMSLCK
jgi:hypothetical protein